MRRQFTILYRLFLARLIDLDILSARGDVRELLARSLSILAALSLCLTYLIAGKYFSMGLPRTRYLYAIWNDEEFLISATIAVAGLFAVLAWNTVFPDRRDCLILGVLPVATPVIILAKLSAMATALGVSVFAINAFTGMVFPYATVDKGVVPIHAAAAWWITVFAAGIFTFSAMLAIQGLAAQVLSWSLFLRISGLLQLAALFTVIALFFVTPPFAATMLDHAFPTSLLPSYWFTGLLHRLDGDPNPVFAPLAAMALRNFSIAAGIATVTWALSYYRNIRRIVQAPDIAPSAHGHAAARIVRGAAFGFLARPLDRAILLFTCRTIARSRQHRLLLAACGGIGFATALAFSRTFLEDLRSHTRWDTPAVPLLVDGLLLLYCAVAGIRGSFSIPLALPANWIFRITAVHSPAAYFAAVRKSLLIVGVLPVWLACLVAYFSIWPGRPAFEHMLVLTLAGLLLADCSLYQFRKMPFACSWLPGGVQLKMRASVYALLFLTFASIAANIELRSLERFARFVVILAILGSAAVWARRRAFEFAGARGNRLQFEDLPEAEVFALDLRQDGDWSSDEAYVDAIDPHAGRSFARRLRPLGIWILVFLIVGFDWERIGEWRDGKLHPQAGTSYNIGGRSLNINCAGAGSPAVILETNWGMPGFSWTPVQRAAAAFTRVCWYDRAGAGWSDPGPFPNHSDSVARDLHQLLGAAHIPPPYVLVGHSMGAFHARVFRGFYKSEVAGMVLVDPMSEDITVDIHNHIEAFRPAVILFYKFLGIFGGFRLLEPDPGPPPRGMNREEWLTTWTLRWQPKSVVSQTKEVPLWINGELARSAGALGSLPLVVLSAGIPGRAEDTELESQERKLELHERLARSSTRGRHIVVPNSNSQIPFEAPEAVVAAIRSVLAETSGKTR
ncbi:MAG TPA: alpha/beta hydrolase [Bryobacteraceae bacterium]|nr:alpha/beta hydrolase [Bryobacteraceae bacterium]